MPVYLNLYHGRPSVAQEVDDEWGPHSIWFKFDFVGCEYDPTSNGIRVRDKKQEWEEAWLSYVEDLIYYGGWFYGAWSIHSGLPEDDELKAFDPKDAMIPVGKKLISVEYDVGIDKEPLTAGELSVFADSKKAAIVPVTKWVERYVEQADPKLDYWVTITHVVETSKRKKVVLGE